jgi:hypothetical protein
MLKPFSAVVIHDMQIVDDEKIKVPAGGIGGEKLARPQIRRQQRSSAHLHHFPAGRHATTVHKKLP